MRKTTILLSMIATLALADDVSSSSISEATLNKVTATARGFDAKLDELNRNVYIIDKSTIEQKGFKTTEEIFDYVPFVGKANQGLGTNLDLRGQGASSNVNVQVLLNGTNLNMLDSSHGVTPINTIAPSDIERVEILPGGGAVMYGNGTRGGVINIITKKRYESFSPNIGVSYKGTPTNSKMFGSEVNVDARFGGNIAHKLYYSLSGRYLYKYGYRKGDESNAYNVGGNLTYDFNDRHSLSLDASYYKGIVNTSPNLLFYTGVGLASRVQVDNSPIQDRRYNAGEGTIKTIQDRADVVLTYEGKLAENHKLQVKALYHYLKNKYDTNVQDLWYNGMWVPNFSQSGSYFTDQKMGGQIRYDWNHRNGLFIAGFDSIYNIGERYLALMYDLRGMGTTPPMNMMGRHYLYTPITMNKLSNSLYAIEKYDFTQRFSLTLGARYENANYTGTRKYSTCGPMPDCSNPTPNYGASRPNYTISDNISNFALELTPKYEFGSGNVYAKYERGFRSPNPDNLSSMSGNAYVDSNVRSEYYHTFEIGSKLNLGSHVFVSGAVFYTLTENELYNYGSAHSGFGGFGFGNYGLTQRVGVELFSEQAFFERSLRFSESFTYVDARILSGSRNGVNMDNRLIPYVSNYKATIGANWDISKHFGIWTQNSFVGEQRDLANRRIDAYILTDLGVDMRFGDFNVAIGVRNLFNTLYFMYYNSDTSDLTIGNAYLYAPGRTFFADLRYAF